MGENRQISRAEKFQIIFIEFFPLKEMPYNFQSLKNGLCISDFLPKNTVYERGKHRITCSGKPTKHSLSQVMKGNVSTDKSHWQNAALMWCEENNTAPLWPPPEKCNSSLTMRKTASKTQLRNNPQNIDQLLKPVKFIKNKNSLGNCHSHGSLRRRDKEE